MNKADATRHIDGFLRRLHLCAEVHYVVSDAIGVIFGYILARRAAQLDPFKALRHE